mmetsp:Transcript_139037/g.432556  ORF Transcript_139037/g.432556 Transcript_139037/m.432556 type:complete len:346 (+) Transcript_139037:246-1283(+)
MLRKGAVGGDNLPLVAHQDLRVMPQLGRLVVHGSSPHRGHEDVQGLVRGDVEGAQDRRVDLVRQELAERDVVTHLVSVGLLDDLVELLLVLLLDEEGLDHGERLDALPPGEEHIELSLPLEIGERNHAWANFIFPKSEHASVLPLRHHLGVRREIRAKNVAQVADERTLQHPALEAPTGGEELLLGRLLAEAVHRDELVRPLRRDVVHLLLDKVGRPNPEVHSAQADAVAGVHSVGGLLQELPPLLAAGAIRPDVVLSPIHLRKESEAQDLDLGLVRLRLLRLAGRGHAEDLALPRHLGHLLVQLVQELRDRCAHRAEDRGLALGQVGLHGALPLAGRRGPILQD